MRCRGSRSGERRAEVMKRCYSRQPAGFTLIELLVVIAIIGLLLTILVPVVQTARLQGEVSGTQARVTELAGACDLYHKDTGYYPGQNDPGKLTGTPTAPAPHYTGSQYLAGVLFNDGYAQVTRGDLQTINGKPNTISDRTSKNMAILYYPARRNLTGLGQYKYADNSTYTDPTGITEAMFRTYIRNPALDDNTTIEPNTDEPFADGKFIIVAPNYKGAYFTGGPTFPGL